MKHFLLTPSWIRGRTSMIWGRFLITIGLKKIWDYGEKLPMFFQLTLCLLISMDIVLHFTEGLIQFLVSFTSLPYLEQQKAEI
jgi:hypothetical protein